VTQSAGQLLPERPRVEIVQDRSRLEAHPGDRIVNDERLPVTDRTVAKQWRGGVERHDVDRVVPDGADGLSLEAELELEASALIERAVEEDADVHVGQRPRLPGRLGAEQIRGDDALAVERCGQPGPSGGVEGDRRTAIVEADHGADHRARCG